MRFIQRGRREFITLIGGAVAAWPLAVRAQQSGTIRRIGMLTGVPANDPEATLRVNAILDGLRSLGWIEGVNMRFLFGPIFRVVHGREWM
jgi:putative tryptophan/tyrosine transport system substrate-binding protein